MVTVELLVRSAFAILVFFHLIPERGEVIAVADHCFQILYKIFRALFEISSFFLNRSQNGRWKFPTARSSRVWLEILMLAMKLRVLLILSFSKIVNWKYVLNFSL